MRRYVLINAFTSKVGNGTNMSGKPTNQALAPNRAKFDLATLNPIPDILWNLSLY